MSGLVAQKTLALVLLDTRLTTVLGSVPFAVAIYTLHVSSVTRRRSHGGTGSPRREPASWWCSTSCETSSHKLLGDESVDLGSLGVGRQVEGQDLRNARLCVDTSLIFRLRLAVLVLNAAERVYEVQRATMSLLVLENLHQLQCVFLDG